MLSPDITASRRTVLTVAAGAAAATLVGCTEPPHRRLLPTPTETTPNPDREIVQGLITQYVADTATRMKRIGDLKNGKKISGFTFTSSDDGHYVQYDAAQTTPPTKNKPSTKIEILADGRKQNDNVIDPANMTLLSVTTTTDFSDHQERTEIIFQRAGIDRTGDWTVTSIVDTNAGKLRKGRDGGIGSYEDTFHQTTYTTDPQPGTQQLNQVSFNTVRQSADDLINKALS